MNAVERPRKLVAGEVRSWTEVFQWIEYADYLEARLLTVTEERDELKWMREELEK